MLRRFTKYFSPTHEYIDLVGKIGKIGITAFAEHNLGEVQMISINVGSDAKKGDEIGTIEAAKAVSPIMTPMSGKIVDKNQAAFDDPTIVNKNPESDGWIAQIEISDENEIKELMNEEQYKKFLKG